MQPFERPSFLSRVVGALPLILSAALVALAIELGLDKPWAAALLIVIALLLLLPRALARRRVRALLMSGDVDAMLSMWGPALSQVPHRETMVPLIAATALAANGMTDRARNALERAARGPAWEAALEHRLLVETLLDAFEGDRDKAVAKAAALTQLPLPPVGWAMQDRVRLLRSAAFSLARAFAHLATADDLRVLGKAANLNPMLHWALRYAAAVVCIDTGQPNSAQRLLAGAPEWPEESAFAAFHRELCSHAAA